MWKGNIKTSKEWLLIIKSTKFKHEELEKVIKNTHPYQVPETITVLIITGSKDYLEWMDKEIG